MKTLVTHKHSAGPHQNGYDGCDARTINGGMCPGIKIAKWLNELGNDDEPYSTLKKPDGTITTNGKLRDNWLRECYHIEPLNPRLAYLSAEQRRLSAELRRVNHELATVRIVKADATLADKLKA